MMKKLFLLGVVAIFLVGCSHIRKVPLSNTSKTLEEKVIDYEIEKIILSKGFQSINPMVEATKEGGKLKLIVSTGIVECSGINIDKVTKTGNTINLYISALFENDKIQIAIPQATVIIEEPIGTNVESLSFNIVSQNYDTISLKYNKDQIIDKIRGEFKIESNTTPQVELIKDNDNIHWNITFTNLIHKNNSKSPLSNLKVEANALTGEVLDYEKETISTYLDEGYLMDYLPNQLILYKKVNRNDDIQYDSLWTYDVNTGKKEKIYTTKYKIQNAYFNTNGEYISLVEKDNSKGEVFLIETSNKITFKITPPDYFHPKLLKWKNNNELCIIDINGEISTIFTYNIAENKLKRDLKLDKVIESVDIMGDMIVFTEADELNINKNIFLIDNNKNIEQIGTGFKPAFFNDKDIIYLVNDEDINKNMMKFYNTEKNSIMNSLDYNIVNYYKLDDETILFIENTNFNNEYSLIKYHVGDRTALSTYKVNSPTLFYDSDEEKAYISLTISSNDINKNNIYCVDLSKLSTSN